MRFTAPLYLPHDKQPPLQRHLPRLMIGAIVLLALVVIGQVSVAISAPAEAANRHVSIAVGAFLAIGVVLLGYRLHSQRVHGYIVLNNREIRVKVGGRPWVPYPLAQVEELQLSVQAPEATAVMTPPGRGMIGGMAVGPMRATSIGYHATHNTLRFRYSPSANRRGEWIELAFLLTSQQHYRKLSHLLKQWRKQQQPFYFSRQEDEDDA